ncbi:Pre-rRNA-processing protein ipi3 [Dimargaris verticillata]|uniref:Pre-rRNA-processing protein ipi3 n=1 Tax=Dimargaris verticillata TaxID=2761393 RepID=A0A9W8B0H9_9FUNG|nr:Pre-rRNA-processing protein ipi3 [Dimargaris verticillata]
MFNEIALTTSSDAQDHTTYAWDIRTNTLLATFKQSSLAAGTLAPLRAPGRPLHVAGFLGVQAERPVFHGYAWRKDQAFLKFACPEKITAVASSPCSRWVVAGSVTGKLYLWEASTGRLAQIWDAHYKAVTRIRFSRDAAAIVSGSEDAVVCVWSLADVLEPLGNRDNGPMIPALATSLSSSAGSALGLAAGDAPCATFTWTDHTLPITDIACGLGLDAYARIVTASRDRTCKIWEASTGDLLTTLLFPAAVTCIVLDPTEIMLYAGTETGIIWKVNLYRHNQSNSPEVGNTAPVWEAVGGQRQIIDVGHTVEQADKPQWPVFRGHTQSVTTLDLSLDGTMLVSGSADSRCLVWDCQSLQQLRAFTYHKGCVSNLLVTVCPPELSGSLHSLGPSSSASSLPCLQPFKRIVQDDSSRAADGSVPNHGTRDSTGIMQHIDTTDATLQQALQLLDESHLHSSEPAEVAQAGSVAARLRITGSADQLESQVTHLQTELSRIQEHHAKLRLLNDELYQASVTRFMNSYNQQTPASSDAQSL